MQETKTYRAFDWINRHARLVIVAVLLGALTLGFVGSTLANTDEPNFDPSGEIFDVAERADGLLGSESSIRGAAFLVESADGGDVLTAVALAEWLDASKLVRAEDAGAHLVTRYDSDLGASVEGIVSIAEVVDAELPQGLAGATDSEVKGVLNQILDPAAATSSFRFTLSEKATFENGIWTAPAFIALTANETSA